MKSHIVTAAVAALTALGIAAMARGEFDTAQHEEVSIPICQMEDGSDVDGLCFWIDPDTGDMYLNPTDAEVQRSLHTAGWEYVGGFN